MREENLAFPASAKRRKEGFLARRSSSAGLDFFACGGHTIAIRAQCMRVEMAARSERAASVCEWKKSHEGVGEGVGRGRRRGHRQGRRAREFGEGVGRARRASASARASGEASGRRRASASASASGERVGEGVGRGLSVRASGERVGRGRRASASERALASELAEPSTPARASGEGVGREGVGRARRRGRRAARALARASGGEGVREGVGKASAEGLYLGQVSSRLFVCLWLKFVGKKEAITCAQGHLSGIRARRTSSHHRVDCQGIHSPIIRSSRTASAEGVGEGVGGGRWRGRR